MHLPSWGASSVGKTGPDGPDSGAVVSSQANPRAGFWVADGIFRALAQGQAGSGIKAALQEPGRVVWLAESVSREKRLWGVTASKGQPHPLAGPSLHTRLVRGLSGLGVRGRLCFS